MNQSELVAKVAEENELSKAKAEAVVKTVLDAFKSALKSGKKISIIGFVTMQVIQTKETTGINPQTKAKIKIPSRRRAKAKFSDAFQKELN